jgi:hypothetical protein
MVIETRSVNLVRDQPSLMVPPPAAEQKGAFSVFSRLLYDLRKKIWLEIILAPTEIKIQQVYLQAATWLRP